MSQETTNFLEARRVAIIGKLSSLTYRDACDLIRHSGGTVCEKVESRLGPVDLVIVGDEHQQDLQRLGAIPGLEVLPEDRFYERLKTLGEDRTADESIVRKLYTPAMLAELVGIPVTLIRRWYRRRIIAAQLEVHRLPYFGLEGVATARTLAKLLAAGVTPREIEKKLATLIRRIPSHGLLEDQLEVVVDGQDFLIRRGDELYEPGGQKRIDFDSLDEDERGPATIRIEDALDVESDESSELSWNKQDLVEQAAVLEEQGHLEESAEFYRAALAAGGPDAEICFHLAENLYRLGDISAARERYFVAVELDEDYVEARANLGCVLAELGQRELAIAAFQGALLHHSDYPDVHYHLAKTLDEDGEPQSARYHWRRFVELAPDSPWAEEARERLARDSHDQLS